MKRKKNHPYNNWKLESLVVKKDKLRKMVEYKRKRAVGLCAYHLCNEKSDLTYCKLHHNIRLEQQRRRYSKKNGADSL